MWISRLEVADFRNHPAAALDFAPGVTLLLGANGAGKTSLLEAVGFLSTLGSHRAGTDGVLVRRGAAAAVVRGVVQTLGREVLLEAEWRPGRGVRARRNGMALPRARDLLGTLRTVIFSPEDLALVRGDPDERRRFLDGLAVQRHPSFASVKADFDRSVRHANSLLKSLSGRRVGPQELAVLEVWEDRVAVTGAAVWERRREVVAALAERTRHAVEEVSAGTSALLALHYQSSASQSAPELLPGPDASEQDLCDVLRELFARDRRRSIERGALASGPHRDDLSMHLGENVARLHASQGEAWTIALALRLASYRWLASDGEPPVLLLDDVFAQLDSARRQKMARLAHEVDQAVVTAASEEEVPHCLEARRLRVQAGAVVDVS